MATNKTLIGTGLAAIFVTVTVAGYKLFSKSSASDKLFFDFSEFKMIDFKKESLSGIVISNPSAIFRTTFNVKNPSNEELSFTQPDIELSTLNKKKKKKIIARSPVSDNIITIKPKKSAEVNIDLAITALNMLGVIDDFFGFLIRKIKGEPPSKEVTLAYTYSSEGIEFQESKKVLI